MSIFRGRQPSPATDASLAIAPSLRRPRSIEGQERKQLAQSAAATDRRLIQRFNGGDAAAFDEIVARYRDKIQAVAQRLLRNQSDAEEVAQDTMIRAYRGLARFRGEASLATWLHRIAVNLARNRYWYLFRRRRHLTLSLESPLHAEKNGTLADIVGGDEPDAAQEAATGEFVALVARCMNQLDPRHREILTLLNQLHHSYAGIARQLGINEGTVKSRIARARGKLKEQMVVTCPEFVAATPRDWFEPVRSRHGARALSAA